MSKDKQRNHKRYQKIKIGRLLVDPVVALLLTFFATSALLLQLFIWFSLRH